MQADAVTLSIESVEEIAKLYKNIKSLNRNSPGYAGKIVICLPDEGLLLDDDIIRLVKIMARLRCHELAILTTTISIDPSSKLNFLRHLRTIELTACRGSMTFIKVMLYVCPNLLSLSELGVERFPVLRIDRNRSMLMVERSEGIINALKINYSLSSFESSSISQEIKLLLVAGIHPGHRSIIQKYNKTMKALLKRNRDGYAKCNDAILQIFLIKRYRPDSVFRFVNFDVVRLIAKLLHNSRGTRVWCQ